MKEGNKVGPYVRNGILIGLFFPVLAIVICVFFLHPEDESISLRSLHKNFPLLWIIDSAPLVLGFISYAVGKNVNKLNTQFLDQIKEINKMLMDNNAQLEILVDEKEVLLKEIHHRVKNNLQVITSLLSLQSNFIEDDKTKALFRHSQYRINSMAMIHEMLYKSQNISKINFGSYAKRLIEELIISMKGSEHNIEFKADIPHISLNIDTAIPLGLLINEIITNSLKYGIREDLQPKLHLKIKRSKHNNYTMLIGDNGSGFDENINFRNTSSLGLMLIHKLTVQLQGTIEMDTKISGTNYIINLQEIQPT
jgi:two-component sensor histidine kinase